MRTFIGVQDVRVGDVKLKGEIVDLMRLGIR